MENQIYDVTVIGGGPVGMFAAYYAGLRNAKVQIIESLSHLGGQVQALYPSKTVLDVAGYAGLSGKALIQELKKQMDETKPDVKLGQAVTQIKKTATGYEVVTPKGTTQTKAIVVAIGGGAFQPCKLMVPGAKDLEGRQLFYSVQDVNRFKNQTVLVAGGGNSAVDNALLLNKVAKHVYLLHRRNQFRGLERMVDRAKKAQIDFVTPYLIRALKPVSNGQLDVTIKKMMTEDDLRHLKVDAMVVNYGYRSDDKALRQWKLGFNEEHRRLKVGAKCLTNVPRIYAVGDAATYPGKDTLIATGFGEVPIVINDIMRTLYPKRLLPIHSTGLKR